MIDCKTIFLLQMLSVFLSSLVFSDDIERDAISVLSKSCAGCHGEGNDKHGDIDFITDKARLLESGLINPEDVEASRILVRMLDEADPMPPEDAPSDIHRPSKAEIEKVRSWISSLKDGPADATANARITSSEKIPTSEEIHRSIINFLDSKPKSSHSRWRFFSFTNLAQLKMATKPRNVAFQKIDLSLHRAALAKAINSLHWRADIAEVEAVGDEQLLLAVDLGQMWNSEFQAWSDDREWLTIMRNYPYGLLSQSKEFEEIQRLTKTQIPIVRADWFIATALRPPLYHDLLGIPLTAKVLESKLGVNIESNLLSGIASRVGFTNSGVSKRANRLIERHSSKFGFYWKSYDFLSDSRRGNLIQFPNGPEFPGNPFPESAFDHDGGEIIFSLPNGLQGYMLVDRIGNRIDAGPAELVKDDKEVSGSPLIVNGISCIACHRNGMIRFPKDEILSQTPVAGDVREFVATLHDSENVDRLTSIDSERFVAALGKVIGPWMRDQGQDERTVTSFSEPITPVASFFVNSELGLTEVAAELGIPDEMALAIRIENDPKLQEIGLKPLVSGGVIKRDDWQRIATGPSKFQQTIRIMNLGVPITIIRPSKR